MTDKIDPKTIDYPATASERETYMRLKLAKGEKLLTPVEVERIQAARRRRETR